MFLYFKKAKTKQGDKLPAISQLLTGAIKLRVNLPGFPWINQELSQRLAGQGEGIGRAWPPPRGLQHRSAATVAWPRRGSRPSTNKGALTGLPGGPLRRPCAQKTRPDPTAVQGSGLLLELPFQRMETMACALWSRDSFSPEWNVNARPSFFAPLRESGLNF